MGVMALAVMIWIVVAIIVYAVKKSKYDPVKIGCAVGLMSISLHNLVDFNFHIPANMLLFTVCAAIAVNVSRSNNEGA